MFWSLVLPSWWPHPSSLPPQNPQQSPLGGHLPPTSHHASPRVLDASPRGTSSRHGFLHRSIHPALSGHSASCSNPRAMGVTLLTRHWNLLSKSCFVKTPLHLKRSQKQKAAKRSGECGVRTGHRGRRHWRPETHSFRITHRTTVDMDRKMHALRGSGQGTPGSPGQNKGNDMYRKTKAKTYRLLKKYQQSRRAR